MPHQHRISLQKAKEMTKRYRDTYKSILKDEYKDSNLLALSEAFNKKALSDLLNNPDAEFIRIYYGMSEDLNIHAILVGADKDGNDILPLDANTESHKASGDEGEGEGEENYIWDDGMRCPINCPPPSPLNDDEG